MPEAHPPAASPDPTPPSEKPRSAGEEAAPEPAVNLPAGDGAPIDPAREQDIWAGRTSWKHYLGRVLLWAAGCILLAILVGWLQSGWEALTFWAAVGWTLLIVVVAGVIVFGGIALKVLSCRYRVSTQRLFIERGIFSRTVDQTELIRVDDVRLYKGVLDRICGLGTVIVRSTDASDNETVIAGVADPEQVAEAIRQHMRTLRRKSLFVENL